MIQATPNDEVRESTTGSTTGMEDAVNLLGWPVSALSLSPSVADADALIARTSAQRHRAWRGGQRKLKRWSLVHEQIMEAVIKMES